MEALQEVFMSSKFGEVRVINRDGEPFFVARDVCKCLGLKNTSQAVAQLDTDEKGISSTYTLGGSQSVLMVNESGLYHLIFMSRKEEARAFRKWVTSEVLPIIRKTGRFAVDDWSSEADRMFARWNKECNEVWIPRLLALESGKRAT